MSDVTLDLESGAYSSGRGWWLSLQSPTVYSLDLKIKVDQYCSTVVGVEGMTWSKFPSRFCPFLYVSEDCIMFV